ncbi:MAG: ISAzo13 family transposase [Gemmataceae bacterium]
MRPPAGPKKGGGRPPLTATCPALEANLRQLLQEFTAGDPMRQGVLWTNLSLRELSRRLAGMGSPASRRVIRRLLRQMKVGCRTARKKKSMGHHKGRNAQFENIARLPREYQAAGDPVISIDTKKKELLGNFHRPGTTFTEQAVQTFDHDFPTPSGGKVIPHGVYDLGREQASIHLNTSHDTGELCCDGIALWWQEHGKAAYPNARRLLILCDGGGSNSATQYLFKEDLQRLADRLGLGLRVAHYPPYCSRHNPIEHRVFPHVTRACRGVIFHTVEVAKQFIERAKTNTGLRVTVSLLDKVYATGWKVAEGFKDAMKILFDDHLPKWNYRALPQSP